MLHHPHSCACGRPLPVPPSLEDLATEAAAVGREVAAVLAREPLRMGPGWRETVDDLLARLAAGDALDPRAGEALDILGEYLARATERETSGTKMVLASFCDEDGDVVLGRITVPDRTERGEALAEAGALLAEYREARSAVLDRAAGERAAQRLLSMVPGLSAAPTGTGTGTALAG